MRYTKTFIVFLLVVLCLALVGCQNAPSTATATAKVAENSAPVLVPVRVSGKWGYVNTTGQLVVNPQFDYAVEFHEGRAAVCIGKPCNWGYIDTSGKLIVTPQYDTVSSFTEGLALVCTANYPGSQKRGYIDRDGKLVIPMQFAAADDFQEGLARVCIGKCDYEKDSSGEVSFSGKYGFIDHSGHFVINPQYDYADKFTNGLAMVTLVKGDDAKTGYIDKTGKTIWQP